MPYARQEDTQTIQKQMIQKMEGKMAIVVRHARRWAPVGLLLALLVLTACTSGSSGKSY